MLLDGAHDSRSQPDRARGAEGAVRGAVVRCAARGAAFCKACLQTPWPVARAVEGGSTHRFVATRTDSWAYGYKPLLILRNPYAKIAKLTAPQPNCLPNLRLQTAPSQTPLCALSNHCEAAEHEKLRA